MSVILAAGLHGIDEKMDPGKRLDIDMYAEGHKVKDAKKLPLNLLDALRNYGKDTYLKQQLGTRILGGVHQAQDEGMELVLPPPVAWEKETTLDC